jgi:hypothetical protein
MLETRQRWRKQSKPLTLFKSKGNGPGRARGRQARETAVDWLLANISAAPKLLVHLIWQGA